MPTTADKLRLLLRAELLRGRIAGRMLAVRACIYAFAILVAAIGVVMLVIAAHLALTAYLGPIYGALLTGGALIVLAVLLALLAVPLSRRPSAEAADDLERVIRGELMQDLRQVEANVRRIESGVSNLGSGLGGGAIAFLAFGLGLAALSPRLRKVLFSLLR